jgi:hypothetical protein
MDRKWGTKKWTFYLDPVNKLEKQSEKAISE